MYFINSITRLMIMCSSAKIVILAQKSNDEHSNVAIGFLNNCTKHPNLDAWKNLVRSKEFTFFSTRRSSSRKATKQHEAQQQKKLKQC